MGDPLQEATSHCHPNNLWPCLRVLASRLGSAQKIKGTRNQTNKIGGRRAEMSVGVGGCEGILLFLLEHALPNANTNGAKKDARLEQRQKEKTEGRKSYSGLQPL